MARTIAIVVAAGSGTRLGAGVPKAFALLEGRSLVERALDGLAASGGVAGIRKVVLEADLDLEAEVK